MIFFFFMYEIYVLFVSIISIFLSINNNQTLPYTNTRKLCVKNLNYYLIRTNTRKLCVKNLNYLNLINTSEIDERIKERTIIIKGLARGATSFSEISDPPGWDRAGIFCPTHALISLIQCRVPRLLL